MPGRLNVEDRILARIRVDESSGCWIWLGGKRGQNQSYGIFITCSQGKRKAHQAHRFVYELYKEKIPEGKQLDHLCRVRLCVNPDHLEPVTLLENVRRGFAARKLQKK